MEFYQSNDSCIAKNTQQNLIFKVLDTIRKNFVRFAHKHQNSEAKGFMAVEQAVSQAKHTF